MTMKKKLLTTLSVVLILGLAALGILAYLTSEDSDVNVMTLGNVDIEQTEWERATINGEIYSETQNNQETYILKEFSQNKPLLPIVGDPSLPINNPGYAGWDDTTVWMGQGDVDSHGTMQVFAGKNAVDKFVVVKNTGKTDAYVRTLVAIEVGSTDGSLIGTSYHKTWKQKTIGIFEIDGNNYLVYEYAYQGGQLSDGTWRHKDGILPAGETAYPNLSQVYIKSEATNEDCEAIDGNDDGMLDIVVLSQAVQVAGFENAQNALDTAFGTVEDNAVKWFEDILCVKTPVDSVKDLTAAIEKGEDVVLTDDVTFETGAVIESTSATDKVKVDLAGNDITFTTTEELGSGIIATDGIIDLVNSSEEAATIKLENGTPIYVAGNSVLNIDNVSIVVDDNTYSRIMIVDNGTVNFNSGTLTGNRPVHILSDDATFNMNGGVINVPDGMNTAGIDTNNKDATINLNGGKIVVGDNYAYGIIAYKAAATINVSDAFVFELNGENSYAVQVAKSGNKPTINSTSALKTVEIN